MCKWTCDRCKKEYIDTGVRFSNLPSDWVAYYLASVSENEKEEIRSITHMCDHCAYLPLEISIGVKK